jgi:hypothetical protein
MLALVLGTMGALSAASYCVGRNIDFELRFLEPRRPPTFDEATIAYPIEYALRSNEKNDVIFLGDSTCRFGVDPVCFEHLSGLRGYNLGSVGGYLGPMGFLLTAKAYLLKHPPPQIVVLCMTPFGFQIGTAEMARRKISMPARFAANFGPEVPGVIPLKESLVYFIKRGSVAAGRATWSLSAGGDPDVRDLPITESKETYRTFQRKLRESRGHWVPPEVHGKKSEGAHDDPSWPGEPIKVDADWDCGVRDLAETCRSRGILLLIRFTPVSAALSQKDYTRIERWAQVLQQSCHHVTVGCPTLLWYDPKLCWDGNHLNAAGAATFTSLLAKEVRAALVPATPSIHK